MMTVVKKKIGFVILSNYTLRRSLEFPCRARNLMPIPQ